MAFIYARKSKRGKTWYVGYYVNGRFLSKRVGRSKAIAEKASHSASYHCRNERVIRQFKRFLQAKRPYLTKLSQLRPEVMEEYQRFRLSEVVPNSGKPIKKRTVNIEVGSLSIRPRKAPDFLILKEIFYK